MHARVASRRHSSMTLLNHTTQYEECITCYKPLQVPEWVFQQSPAELKQAFLTAKKRREIDSMLMTRAYREKLAGGKTQKGTYIYAVIRVRLPEGLLLQVSRFAFTAGYYSVLLQLGCTRLALIPVFHCEHRPGPCVTTLGVHSRLGGITQIAVMQCERGLLLPEHHTL